MLALPLNLHSALFTASQLALCTVHWLRTCTMHCFSADCTFVSTLLQARCIHAICHVCVDPVRRVILDLMLNFFCRISSFYIFRKMSNSMYCNLQRSPKAWAGWCFFSLMLTVSLHSGIRQKTYWSLEWWHHDNTQGFHHSTSSMMFSPDLLLCPFVPLLLCFFALLLLCSVVAAWSRVHEVCHLLGAQCRPKIGCFQFGTATNQPTNRPTQSTQHQHQHRAA